MLKKYWQTGLHLLLLGLFALLLLLVCLRSNPSRMPFMLPARFQGEYSQDGSEWQPLTEDTKLSALDGDLSLRGNFNCELPENGTLSFYVDHLDYEIDVNGDCIARSPSEKRTPSTCSRRWESVSSPGITAEDTVEIHLHNPHSYGNANAYRDFLASFYPGSGFYAESVLENMLQGENIPYRVVGILLLIFSIGILGIAAAFLVMRVPGNRRLWALGLLSFGMGGYIALDTTDVSLWSGSWSFNTYGQLLCMMLAAWELGIFLESCLSAGSKKAARLAVWGEGGLLTVISLLCLSNQVLIYDTLPVWAIAQLLLCPLLLGCCVWEWWRTRRNLAVLLSVSLLLFSTMLDLVNGCFLWWPKGRLTKMIFVFLFVFYLVWGVRKVPASYQKAAQADQLADDLKNSRIILAMSQIRTHFIFNILNAISGMCKYDPEKADRTVVRFARYLRNNIDIMQNDQPVTFRSELRHLEDYVALEQIRFGDQIRFVTNITVDDFLLPPLILQPLVENSIKHGLTPKQSVGTITLRTWVQGNDICIAVQDDGVGFDPKAAENDRSVGLENVRFRLRHMMNGSLKVDSAPGRGTAVTVSIPQEEIKKCM